MWVGAGVWGVSRGGAAGLTEPLPQPAPSLHPTHHEANRRADPPCPTSRSRHPTHHPLAAQPTRRAPNPGPPRSQPHHHRPGPPPFRAARPLLPRAGAGRVKGGPEGPSAQPTRNAAQRSEAPLTRPAEARDCKEAGGPTAPEDSRLDSQAFNRTPTSSLDSGPRIGCPAQLPTPVPLSRGPDYPLRCVRRPRMGSSRRFLGFVCSPPPEHASDPQPRYRPREADPTASPCTRTALSGRCPAAAGLASDSGYGIPSGKGGRIHRRLLLARLPRALRPAEDQPGILVSEGTSEHGTRPRHGPTAQGSGMARTPLLGARAIRHLRK
ncbi:hypothetical protein ABIE67_003651 [Streptomyces sp. V4I8]